MLKISAHRLSTGVLTKPIICLEIRSHDCAMIALGWLRLRKVKGTILKVTQQVCNKGGTESQRMPRAVVN